jgi:hypothetical protein
MQNKSQLSKDDVGTLILLAAFLFGTWFRIMPAWMAGFPVNDGGMFYTMIQDLQANHYFPPLYTTYNQLQIPFAYPPLGFYIGAAINDLLHVPLLEVIRWLPGIINALCVPAFYLFAKEVLQDKFQSAMATLVFAFTPHLTTWLSAGGGLTRSLGTLFLILTMAFAYQLLAKNNNLAIFWTVIFGSLTVLSHTESTVFAVAIPIFIWLVKSPTLKSALQGGLVALGVLVLAGTWYGLIISRHGIETLLSALQTGGQTIWSILRLINIDIITEEPYLDLLGVFGVLGMIYLAAKKEYFIPIMLLVIYLVQPRSAHTVGNIPLALAAGIFTTEILLPAISKMDETSHTRSVNILLLFLTTYLLANSIYQEFLFSQNHVTEKERNAMQWIKENTPADSRFLVLTGESDAMCDSNSEWFPALTKRISLFTPQGMEWLKKGQFSEGFGRHANLQRCIEEGSDCLTQTANSDFNYVYITIAPSTQNCKALETLHATRGLVTALEKTNEYSIIYRSEQVVLFKKK